MHKDKENDDHVITLKTCFIIVASYGLKTWQCRTFAPTWFCTSIIEPGEWSCEISLDHLKMIDTMIWQ
jgi:hypothetical protein